MPTTAQGVITYARRLLDDINGQRWSDAALLDFLDRTSKQLMRDVLFPPARIMTATVPNQQLYRLPVVLSILSVYVNGQLSTPTDQRTLEGHQIDLYDQGFYGADGTQTAGSAGPTGTTGTFTPKWNIQPPADYPVTNTWGWPRPDAQTWGVTQPPRYFWRGGFLALVPAPANAPQYDTNGGLIPNLCIDCVMLPDTISTMTQILWYNENFVEALASGIIYRAKYSDATQDSQAAANAAIQAYRQAVADLRIWKASYAGDAPDGPKVQTSRAYYRGYERARVRSSGYP